MQKIQALLVVLLLPAQKASGKNWQSMKGEEEVIGITQTFHRLVLAPSQ